MKPLLKGKRNQSEKIRDQIAVSREIDRLKQIKKESETGAPENESYLNSLGHKLDDLQGKKTEDYEGVPIDIPALREKYDLNNFEFKAYKPGRKKPTPKPQTPEQTTGLEDAAPEKPITKKELFDPTQLVDKDSRNVKTLLAKVKKRFRGIGEVKLAPREIEPVGVNTII